MRKNVFYTVIIGIVGILMSICVIVLFVLFNDRCKSELLEKTKLLDDGRNPIYKYFDGCLYIFNNDELWLLSTAGNVGDTCFVPQVIDGHKVTGFTEDAIINSQISALVLSDNIKFVDFDMYYEFSSLKSIFIGSGAQKIMDGLFFNCPNLEQVTVNVQNPNYYSENNCILTKEDNVLIASSVAMDSIPSSAKIIGGNSFLNLPFETIAISDGITEIRDLAFQHCNKLYAVFIPDNVVTIYDRIFLDPRAEETKSHITVFCEAKNKPSDWDNNWYYAFSRGYDDEHGDEYYKELNDKYVTIHWDASIEDYYDFINSAQN